MADKVTQTPPSNPTPVNAGATVKTPVNEVTGGPAFWVGRLRPKGALNDDRVARLHFDANFAGAKAVGKWEDEWPVMTEGQFKQALADVAGLKLGGHNPQE